MKVAVSSNGMDLDAPVSVFFGRCSNFVLVDTETMEATALPNGAVGASGGAGVQSAQFVLRQGAEAVISGNVGPNAMQVLSAAGVPVYSAGDTSVRQAIDNLVAGSLRPLTAASVPSDYGKTRPASRLGIGGRGRGTRGGGRRRGR
jgi:predicted Fe-Mo cluster-binding NifX family protein